MPAGKEKSRSLRRKKIITPGTRLATRYTRRPSKRSRCRVCGNVLNASKTLTRKRSNSLSRTERRPERPYGGAICGVCLRVGITKAIRTSSVKEEI